MEDLRWKKALFVTLLGHSTFTKLKTLASPTQVSELAMDDIMELLLAHFRLQTIEIAERFEDAETLRNSSRIHVTA